MTARHFLLCLGAPKCGTTWLYHYLRSFREVALGFKKEYHIFDAVYLDHCAYFINQMPDPCLVPSNPFMEKYLNEQNKIKAFRDNHALYFDYFQSLVAGGDSTMTADITPTYIALPRQVLEMIRHEFEKRDIDVKVILLMRDPLERVISAARMAFRLGVFAGNKIVPGTAFSDFMEKFYRTTHAYENTRYQRAVNNIRAVFPENAAYFGFFETMFKPEEIARLSQFLGLAPKIEFASVVYNRTPEQEWVVDEAVLADGRELFDEEYAACHALFPDVSLPEIWRHYGYGHEQG